MRITLAGLILGAVALAPLSAQSVLSVHSGVVHYVEGDAYIGEAIVESKFGHFPEIKPGEVFKTTEGRAEILLTPGSFLRMAENSELRMVSNHLSDTRLELLKGEIVVESVDESKDAASAAVKGNQIAITYGGSTTRLLKAGLYQFTSDPPRLRVYEGEATVAAGGAELLLKRGRETSLEGTLTAEKFDSKVGDELVRWSSRRSGYLAMANVTAARTLSTDTGLWNSYLGSGYGFNGGWAWNPGFGMFTYVPFGGTGFSPFGYNYWSPYSVFDAPFGYGSYGGGYYGGYYPGYYGYPSGGGGGSSVASKPGVVSGGRSAIFTRPPGQYNGTARANIGGFGGSHEGSRGPSSGSGSSSAYAGSSNARVASPAASAPAPASAPRSSGGFSGGGGHSGGGHH